MIGDESSVPPLEEELFSRLCAYDDQVIEGNATPDTEEELSDELRRRWDSARSLIDQLARAGQREPNRTGNDPLARDARPNESSGPHHAVLDGDLHPVSGTIALHAPERIGRFHIAEEIGSGGFGIVLRAFDPTMHRDVALKIPRLGALADEELRNRFVREVRAAAALDHPNIVPVFEAGEDRTICFIASAFCRGPDLAAWLRRREEPVPIKLAADLVSTLAQAVQHAHSRGVLHRDLKPSNVLLEAAELQEVTSQDLSGSQSVGRTSGLAADFPFVPRITDFGLAKISRPGLEETRSTLLLGTLSYMSPEQATGPSSRVGPQSDVYSLGVILYELLVGRPPLVADSELETLNRLQTENPVPPRRLRPGIPRDLETICLMCLDKEPGRRYASAQLLSDELQRFLRGEPIHARPTPAPVRVWRWCRRRPLAATLITLVASLAIAGPLVATNQARLYYEQSRLYTAAEAAREETNRLLYTSDMNLALQAWEAGNVGRVLQLLERHRSTPGQDYRGFEWHYLWRECHVGQPPTIQSGLPVHCLAVSPDGRLLAVGGGDHLVHLYEAESHREVGQLRGHAAQVISVAFSPSEELMASASWDNTIKLWDLRSQRELPPLKRDPRGVWCVAFSPDGNSIAAANYDGSIVLWDLESRQGRACDHQHAAEVRCVAFSPDGKILASCSIDGVVRLLELDSNVVHECTHPGVWSLTFSPDGETLAVTSEEVIRLLNRSGKELRALRGHRTTVMSVAFSREGHWLASSGEDNMVRIWNAEDGSAHPTLRGHFASVGSVAFSTDGRQLFSGSLDGEVKAWVVSDASHDELHHSGRVHSLAISDDGRLLATACVDGRIRLWDVPSGRRLHTLDGHTQRAMRARFFRFGGQTMLASAGNDGTVKVWDLTSRRAIHTLDSYRSGTKCLAASGDSGTLAWPRSDGTVAVWSLASGQIVASFNVGYAHAVDLSPDGQTLAAASSDRTVRVWDVTSQTLVNSLSAHSGIVHCVRFSFDGALLVTGGVDRSLKLWSTRSLRESPQPVELRSFVAHGGTVWTAAFSPDGSTLTSGSTDHTVRLWDLETGQQRGVLHMDGVIDDLAFSPDGKTLAAACWNGAARLWRAESDPESSD